MGTVKLQATNFDSLWASLTPEQQQAIRWKAQWEQMTLMAVVRNWPHLTEERV